MKFVKYIAVLLCTIIISCTEVDFGDEFLGTQPESSGATLDTLFASAINSDLVLNRAYTYLPYGLPINCGGKDADYNKLGGGLLEDLTDLSYSFNKQTGVGPHNYYYNGSLTSITQSKGQTFLLQSEPMYFAIKYAWIYIENIDRVPDLSDVEKNIRKAEAKMILAISYTEILRNIGGIPWIDHAIKPNDEMKFSRITFEESVNKIVGLLDEVIASDLPWKQLSTDDGKMTKAGAMGLKLRVLLFAASPTFNSDQPWHPDATELTRYKSYDANRWVLAKKAGEDFFKALAANGDYALTWPEEETHQARREAYRSGYYDRGGTEILISVRTNKYNSSAHDWFAGSQTSFWPLLGPTLNYVNMFSWEDGTEFPKDFDWKNPARQPFFDVTASKEFIPQRDPRLYETVAVPGDNVMGVAMPLYVGGNGTYTAECSGFRLMKWMLPEPSDRIGRFTQWPYLRLSEVMLSYAEAICMADGAPNAIAYKMIGDVRARVGLPNIPQGLSKKEFVDKVITERALELGYEEVRWYDLVRHNMKEAFQKPLLRLKSTLLTIGESAAEPLTYDFEVVSTSPRSWATGTFDTKWYLAPIPQNEINKNYGLVQNPGW
ncbi:RagB/SusD family nutrient uptake outer membrane protein [Prolixibacteraceae bacterium]|nr:RagB/SusD family nutrient uptake outer membrane protein [Prolixibacteraceae bacterium]